MKKTILTLIFIFSLITSNCIAESDDSNNIVVLDQSTFIKTAKTPENAEIIQLYKIQNNEIVLVDIVQLEMKKVNFQYLYEFRKLKIENK